MTLEYSVDDLVYAGVRDKALDPVWSITRHFSEIRSPFWDFIFDAVYGAVGKAVPLSSYIHNLIDKYEYTL